MRLLLLNSVSLDYLRAISIQRETQSSVNGVVNGVREGVHLCMVLIV